MWWENQANSSPPEEKRFCIGTTVGNQTNRLKFQQCSTGPEVPQILNRNGICYN